MKDRNRESWYESKAGNGRHGSGDARADPYGQQPSQWHDCAETGYREADTSPVLQQELRESVGGSGARQQGEFPVGKRLVAQVQLDQAAQVRHAVEIDFTARQAIVIGDVMNDGDLHADAAPHVVETDLQRAVGADRDVHRPLRVDQGALQRKVKDFDCMFAIRQEQAGFRLEWDA